jgi:hypothetical protein
MGNSDSKASNAIMPSGGSAAFIAVVDRPPGYRFLP